MNKTDLTRGYSDVSSSEIKVLELYSGTECLSNAFRERGHKCYTVDWDKKFPSNLHIDIEQLAAEQILKEFGTINVSTNNPVRIPIISSKESAYMASSWPSSYKEEYIVIPQIEIIKRKYERTNQYGERCFDNVSDNGINNRNNVDS